MYTRVLVSIYVYVYVCLLLFFSLSLSLSLLGVAPHCLITYCMCMYASVYVLYVRICECVYVCMCDYVLCLD